MAASRLSARAGLLALFAVVVAAATVGGWLLLRDDAPDSADAEYLSDSSLLSIAESSEPAWSAELDGEYLGSVAAGDVILVSQIGPGGGIWLVALERDDGSERWRAETADEFLQPVDRAAVAFALSEAGTPRSWISRDLATGEQQWMMIDEVGYFAQAGRIITTSDADGLAVISPVDGAVERSTPTLAGPGLVTPYRVNAGSGSMVDLYDVNTLEPIIGPIDVGRDVGKATESGDMIFALAPDASSLHVFDRDGRELDELALENRDTASPLLFDASGDAPAVVVQEADGYTIVEVEGDRLVRRQPLPLAEATPIRLDDRSYLFARDPATGSTYVVELPSGKVTVSVESERNPAPFADAIVIGSTSASTSTLEAFDLDGMPRWTLELPADAFTIGNPSFVEGGFVVSADRPDGGSTVTFHE